MIVESISPLKHSQLLLIHFQSCSFVQNNVCNYIFTSVLYKTAAACINLQLKRVMIQKLHPYTILCANMGNHNRLKDGSFFLLVQQVIQNESGCGNSGHFQLSLRSLVLCQPLCSILSLWLFQLSFVVYIAFLILSTKLISSSDYQ